MRSFKDIAAFYTKRFAFHKTAVLSSIPHKDLKVSIVIPAFRENLEMTLNSLAKCRDFDSNQVEILSVLNYGIQASEEIKTYHQAQYETYGKLELENQLRVYSIPAFDLPNKHAGVGLARKIGMDEAVQRFSQIDHDGLVVCLDADCEVSENYVSALLKAESKAVGGLSLYYEHPFRELETGFERQSIVRYEIFLRYYSLGLKHTGYPFPFQTVGSSMASRASHYAKVAGMNRRKAGEDFYFLHKIFPQGKFYEWVNCTIYPSARKSERVPFGTGKAMLAMEKGEKDYGWLYDPRVFEKIKLLLSNLESISKGMHLEETHFEDFLKSENLEQELLDLRDRSNSNTQFYKNFYFWFDGFKVLKYIHFLQGVYADIQNLKACKVLLKCKALDEENLLLELRNMEKTNPHTYI